MSDRTIDIAGTSLVCHTLGRGAPPLVLLHGFTGSSNDWVDVVEDLAVDRRVITFDHRGHGESTNIGDESGYSFARLVGDLETVLDDFGVELCDLLGHSMGGAVAMRYALRHPDRLRSLILMDTAARPIGGPSAELLRGATGLVRTHGMPALLSFADVYSPSGDTPDADRARTQNRAKLEQMDPAAFAALGDELAGSDTIVDDLAGFDRATTVIVGENDSLLRDAADELAMTISGAVLVVIPDAGHSPQIENRSAWLAAVHHHLARVEAAGVR
jgi:pimeloyl-ACP methyl ester carboxylesterase